MAMLAEPKRKQRWTLNPRGKQWSDDSSKFGQKMLEKMGWTQGKGLGANEQGVTDHIRVKYKDDQAGIGFSKDKQEKLWTETQQSFSELLQQLRAGESPSAENLNDLNLSGKSLELKSKQSRARVHYKKFTRGKDVNRYSSKDLANIFGKKDLNELPLKVEPPVTESEPVGASDTTAGVLTIKGGSMSDYFKNKLPLILAKKSTIPVVNESKDESESESERYVGFGFGLSSNSSATDLPDTPRKRKSQFYVENNSETPIADTIDEHTPKKRKVKDFAFENPGLDLISPDPVAPVNKMEVLRPVALECIPQVQNFNDELNEVQVQGQGQEQEKTPKKKKKKKDREQEKDKEIVGFVNDALNLEAKDSGDYSEAFEVSRALGLENDALDLTDESSGKKRVTFNDTVEYNTDKSKKKKSCVKLDKFEIVDDKCRRKKKVKSILVNGEVSSFVNEALDVEIINEEVCDNEVNERKSRGKRKRERRSNLETIEEVEEKVDVGTEVEVDVDVYGRDEDELQDTSDNLGDMSLETPKKKKKSKSKNRDREGRDEFCGNGDKGKDKDKDEDKDRMDIDECGNKENLNDSKSSEITGVKKKKSKKNKKERESLEEVEGIDVEVADNKVEVEVADEFDGSGKSPKVKKAKKILKSLFNKTSADFVGSNINKIKGYGVE
ncbi:G patch domain-containing protein 4 [Microplitis mediator]|uniref:G patch domain-containing protein 4 n=1 Tax=Microplitis mediator TaxID=375433 RepID=UPI0025557C39|nr:G patch domain-containing protein 4 [Microplitis mediator]